MDTLILTQQGAVNLEVKNIAGVIEFLIELNQLKRTFKNDEVDVYECPSVQLKRNEILLEDWFRENNIQIPIQGAVLFPNAKQQFINVRPDLKILFPLAVPVYLRELMNKPPIVDLSTLERLANTIQYAQCPYNPFPICEKYSVDRKTIQTGVLCDQCGTFGMISIARGWICKSCRFFSKDAHKQAIIEYFMLFNEPLTNKACRDFLRLTSSSKARRLLKQMNLPFVGENKGRAYYFPLENMKLALSSSEGR